MVKKGTPLFPDLQKMGLTVRLSLVSYPEHSLFLGEGWILPLYKKYISQWIYQRAKQNNNF